VAIAVLLLSSHHDNVIISTGVLVAYFNRREQWHSWAKVQLAKIQPPLLT
jgi:hypothetical protein